MKTILTTVLAVALGAACAADLPARRRLTPEQARARNAKMTMKRFGGMIRKANSAHGKVLFLNGQTTVSRQDMERALTVIDEKAHPIWEFREAALKGDSNFSEILRANKAELGVFVVEAKNLPMLLVAPESGWAAVNVAAINDGCDRAVLAKRVRVQLLRAFAYVSGGGMLARDPVVMRNDILAPKDLDLITEEDYGIDVTCAFERNLPLRGVTPWRVITYKKACQEGWAPAPTNEFQKAIWDKVHAIPKNPMKIEFDPKKGR